MSSHQKLRDDAYRAFKRNSLDPEVQLALDRLYQRADADARLVLEPEGFLEFASSFISREKTRLDAYRAGEPRAHPYEGTRERPLCTCSDRYCPIKDGRLPNWVRSAADSEEATRQLMHEHSGDPLVIQDMRRSYDELCAEFDHLHRTIIICGTHNLHPDDVDSLGDEPTDDESTDEQATPTPAVADD